ncbi:ABC transporter permease subunit [Gordonia sp. ABSL1-1]|uniref:ABC transporter permease n=1 Tax=Gordonia sp. ABSL1-1 TaxID=3053923 RepID=UPI0025731193|nr:ABC transporter permease subunit [Gordonia sp. ABSL1-1]MDL9935516.1 ABC transporter permease subunit [Gordonia sp. ABSL1-1]
MSHRLTDSAITADDTSADVHAHPETLDPSPVGSTNRAGVVARIARNGLFLGRAIRSEITKLSPRNPLFWLVIPLSIGIPVAMNFGIAKASQWDVIDGTGGIDTNNTGYWLMMLSPFILMAAAVTSFCGEFKDKTVELGSAIQPRRWTMPVAKLIVFSVVAAITVTATILIMLLGFPHLFPEIWGEVELFSGDGVRLLIGVPVYSVLVLALGLGLSVLIPRPGLVIMIVVLWRFVIEEFLYKVMNNDFGMTLQKWGPFANAQIGAGQYPTFDTVFGPNMSLLYFAAYAVAFFVIGLIRLQATDLRSD